MKSNKPVSGLCAGYVFPHPPVIVPAVGKGRESEASATCASCMVGAREIAALEVETLVIVSPHAPSYCNYVYVYDGETLSGSFASFGAPESVMDFKQDTELRSALVHLMNDAGIESFSLPKKKGEDHQELDHGVLVPLHFITQACSSFKIVALASAPFFSQEDQKKLGSLIRKAAEQTGRRVCLIGSGDMSHKVNKESPYGSVPEGAVFDQAVIESLKTSNMQSLVSIDSDIRENAAECGYSSLLILCGAFDPHLIKTELLGYEAPFGIGYCIASFRHKRSDLRVRIARTTLENYVLKQEILSEDELYTLCEDEEDSALLASLLKEKAGVFVSLKKKGELRGCIGTTGPTTENCAYEIIQNAISAAINDPRFEAVRSDELSALEMSVDVLGTAQVVKTREELDPSRWGVIVTYEGRRGLLLPDLEGVDSVEIQLAIACRKAGIDQSDPFSIEKFTVTRFY